MSIIVTGGAGFIGSNFILDWLAQSDETVINIDCLSYAGNASNLQSLQDYPRHSLRVVSINDRDEIDQILDQYRPRAVLNFASESHVDRSIHSPAAFIETNIVGTFNLLESVRAYWDKLLAADKDDFRFLQVSTYEVYGSLEAEADAFSESHQYQPNSPYSASKASSDHLVRAYHHTYGLPVLTTNCSNNYGPFQFPEKLIPLIIHNALAEKPLPIYGDGLQIRDWLYVSDHCAAIRRVLEKGQTGEVYNIGGNSEMTNIDIVSAVCALLDLRKPRQSGSYIDLIEYVADRLGHDRRYAIDASKIEEQLSWRPVETFLSGIEKTVDWYLSRAVT